MSKYCDDSELILCDVTILVPVEDSDRGYLWKAFGRLVRREVVACHQVARMWLTQDVIDALGDPERVKRLRDELRGDGIRLLDVVDVKPVDHELGFFRV